jgi:uncharacterized protein
MKLQPDKSTVQSITGYGAGWIAVDGERINSSIVISSSGLRQAWNCNSFAELTADHFAGLATIDAELVVFGSGERIHFPPGAWMAALMGKRIGLETMDTRAACRTYNILAGEGRRVVAALLIENSSQ